MSGEQGEVGNKAIALVFMFLLGMVIATLAAMAEMVSVIAAGAFVMGASLGYVVGRADLRRELGLPHT